MRRKTEVKRNTIVTHQIFLGSADASLIDVKIEDCGKVSTDNIFLSFNCKETSTYGRQRSERNAGTSTHTSNQPLINTLNVNTNVFFIFFQPTNTIRYLGIVYSCLSRPALVEHCLVLQIRLLHKKTKI